MYFEIGFQGSYCAALCAPPYLSIYNDLLYKNFVEKIAENQLYSEKYYTHRCQ